MSNLSNGHAAPAHSMTPTIQSNNATSNPSSGDIADNNLDRLSQETLVGDPAHTPAPVQNRTSTSASTLSASETPSQATSSSREARPIMEYRRPSHLRNEPPEGGIHP